MWYVPGCVISERPTLRRQEKDVRTFRRKRRSVVTDKIKYQYATKSTYQTHFPNLSNDRPPTQRMITISGIAFSSLVTDKRPTRRMVDLLVGKSPALVTDTSPTRRRTSHMVALTAGIYRLEANGWNLAAGIQRLESDGRGLTDGMQRMESNGWNLTSGIQLAGPER